MTTLQLVFIGIVFVAASAAGGIVLAQLAPRRTRKRLDAVATGNAGVAEGVEWMRTAVRLAGPLARLSLPKEDWEGSRLRLRFLAAGYRDASAMTVYFGVKTLLALAVPTLAWLALELRATAPADQQLIVALTAAAAVGYYLPNLVLARLAALRQREIFENFPDAVDLVLICIEAGLGLDAALVRVAEEMRLKSRAVADELQLVNLEMRAGGTRERALHNLAKRTGVAEIGTFATMLVQADRFGTSIGDSLRVFADEMRTRRRFRAEETAAQISLKLLFPLVFLIFPSLLLVLLGPAFIQVYRILLPTLAGG